jgi:hypothetical protein
LTITCGAKKIKYPALNCQFLVGSLMKSASLLKIGQCTKQDLNKCQSAWNNRWMKKYTITHRYVKSDNNVEAKFFAWMFHFSCAQIRLHLWMKIHWTCNWPYG